jgi:hypothetical protein
MALLDLRALRAELETFLQRAENADPSIVGDARALVRLLETAPEDDPDTWDDLPTLPGTTPLDDNLSLVSWTAVRISRENGERIVTCENARAQVTVIALLDGSGERSIMVGARGHFFTSRITKEGESLFSDDPDVAGPADRVPFSDLERRTREEAERWLREHPRERRWSCANCSWQNDAAAITCRGCGAARDVASAGNHVAPAEVPELAPPAPPGPLMAEPPGLEQIFKTLLATIARAPAAPRFEIVLRGYSPEQREALLQAVRDALRAAGGSVERAEEILSRLPSTIARGLSVNKARDLSERLEALGASLEIRKDRS